jgi:hypothetical protein
MASLQSPRGVMAAVTLVLFVVFGSSALRGKSHRPGEVDAIVVLAGGVGHDGVPHETVMRRLRRAAGLYLSQQSRTGYGPAIICNGGGTTHKPKWVDPSGYAVPEAALMGRELVALGVRSDDVFVEGYSDDTIGNAFFARTMHADARPTWDHLLVITSRFQMARTQAIYDWVFQLRPLPTDKAAYHLEYVAVEDRGALPPSVLRARRSRENTSLKAFREGELVLMTQLSQVHDWIYRRHSGYTVRGMLGKKPLNKTSSLAQTYR